MEFALVSTAFVMMLLGTIDLGRYYFTTEAVRTVTAQAARDALISYRSNGLCPDEGVIETGALARSPFLGANLLDLRVSCPTGSPQVLNVTATYTFRFSVPWFPISPTISDSARLVVEPYSS